jgi:hypothetical protein
VSITLACVNHARLCQSRLLVSITLACVNHACLCQSRLLVSITLACVNHACLSQSRLLVSITLASVTRLPFLCYHSLTYLLCILILFRTLPDGLACVGPGGYQCDACLKFLCAREHFAPGRRNQHRPRSALLRRLSEPAIRRRRRDRRSHDGVDASAGNR